MPHTLEVANLCIATTHLTNASLVLRIDPLKPSVLTVRGPSGCGKTTLLKALSQLIPYESGAVTLDGVAPVAMGVPLWRSRILYVPQRPALLAGTPLVFYSTAAGFGVRKQEAVGRPGADRRHPIDIGLSWNLAEDVWNKEWNQLSGGEAQRASLAIAVSLEPLLLLLDEPTSALDPTTTLLVEKTLRGCNSVWVTHSPEQEERIRGQSLVFREDSIVDGKPRYSIVIES
ncbi:P-loop containing nucleoside triphosphate hydrolase protein [Chytriomyces sp. MP71]|nr:P-loop containing nucleoside triphosphate hydrolase protein [Chytriomyces sp. MP71]